MRPSTLFESGCFCFSCFIHQTLRTEHFQAVSIAYILSQHASTGLQIENTIPKFEFWEFECRPPFLHGKYIIFWSIPHFFIPMQSNSYFFFLSLDSIQYVSKLYTKYVTKFILLACSAPQIVLLFFFSSIYKKRPLTFCSFIHKCFGIRVDLSFIRIDKTPFTF